MPLNNEFLVNPQRWQLERFNRGGPYTTLVFPNVDTAPRVARVCIRVEEFTKRWESLFGTLPDYMVSLKNDAATLYDELTEAMGLEHG